MKVNTMKRLVVRVSVSLTLALTITCSGSGSVQKKAGEQATTRLDAASNERVKVQAQELSDAVLKADYARAADLTYPRLIELIGGRAKFISAMDEEMKQVQSDVFRIESIAVGEPRDVIEVEGQIYAIVPTTMKMKVIEGTLVGEAFMIGVSADRGQNWTFVDSGSSSMDTKMLKTLFPSAAEKLRIPEVKRPMLYRTPDK